MDTVAHEDGHCRSEGTGASAANSSGKGNFKAFYVCFVAGKLPSAFKAGFIVIAENKKATWRDLVYKKLKGLRKASCKEVSMADVEISTTEMKPNIGYLDSQMP